MLSDKEIEKLIKDCLSCEYGKCFCESIIQASKIEEMDFQEAIDRMKVLAKQEISDDGHIEADDILCRVLKKLGAMELVQEYFKVGKWYA